MVYSELLSVAVAFVVIFYTYFWIRFQYWKKKGVPHIEPSIPFGSFESPFSRTRGTAEYMVDAYNKAKEKNWKYVGIFSINRVLLVGVDLDFIKNVMTKDFNYFTDRGGYYNEKDQPISAHLFAIGGIKWRNLRTKLTPTFTTGKMKVMFQTLADCGVILEKYMDEISGNKSGVDIKNITSCFSTDIIGSVAFGLQCNTIKEPNSPFRVYSNKLLGTRRLDIIKISFLQGFPKLSRTLGLVNFSRDVEKFFNDIVRQTVEYREKNSVERKDFLQLLIDIKNSKEEGAENKMDGNTLTMDEIVAQSFVFFFAGHETSSTTMSFCLYELASQQNIQDKVRNEIYKVLKKHNDQITYDSLKEMEYLEQVINETLRMYPPLPFITREAVKDYKIPGTDIIINKGTRVIIPIKAIHYDKSIYPDPHVFDPDRFATDKITSRHQYAHLPFGEGPRICIGMRFGIMQTKAGLISILKNHKVTVNGKTQVPLKISPFSFFPNVVGGIWLNVDKITKQI